jgi:hypothetical protein
MSGMMINSFFFQFSSRCLVLQGIKFNLLPVRSDPEILAFLSAWSAVGMTVSVRYSVWRCEQWDGLDVQTTQWHNEYGLVMDLMFPTTKCAQHCLCAIGLLTTFRFSKEQAARWVPDESLMTITGRACIWAYACYLGQCHHPQDCSPF